MAESSKWEANFPDIPLLGIISRVVHPLSLLSLFIGLTLWEITGRVLGELFVAPPTSVAQSAVRLIQTGELPLAVLGSLQHMFIGFFLSAIIAIPLGFLIGQSDFVRWMLNPYIDAIYATPPIAYLALVIAWFGLRFEARVFFVFIFCFFEMLIVTQNGVESIQDTYTKVGRSFKASWWEKQRKIVFPATLPYVFSGLRLGIGRAVRGMIVAELFLALVYLGRILQNASIRFDTASQLTVVATVAVIGVIGQYIVEAVEERTLPWHFEQ